MLEMILMIIFSAGLLACIFMDISILPALVLGYFIFFGYGLYKKWTVRDMLGFSFQGIFAVKNVLLTFLLIGVITAVWRAGGTIAYIVCHTSGICAPSIILLVTFILCGLLSVLTGSAVASAATIGVICMTIAGSMQVPSWLSGGAVLAGAYFGDRCSPMSTSALLVCEVTKTNLFDNIQKMVRTSIVPFCISCVIYLVIGWTIHIGGNMEGSGSDVSEILKEAYCLQWVTILPAAAVVILSLLKVDVKKTLMISSLLGIVIAFWVQHMSLAAIMEACLTGYHPENAAVSALMSGGGIRSMINILLIVCISSCYAGMFKATHFLDGVQNKMESIRDHTTDFIVVFITAILTGVIACSQALTIMLTNQLCEKSVPDDEKRAIYLENTAVVLSPIIPWSVAATTPLAAVGAPIFSVAAAVYLYILPLWRLLVSVIEKKRESAE